MDVKNSSIQEREGRADTRMPTPAVLVQERELDGPFDCRDELDGAKGQNLTPSALNS
jgi:hypothetical protein